MSVSYVKIFNQVVDEFFKELIEIFPEENKIKVQYNLFQTLSATNAKKPCNDFMINSLPYLEKIAMRDEDFFKSPNKPNLLNSLNIEKLWNDTLSINTKNAIWRYIQSFFTIGVKIIPVPPETMPLITYIINYKN
jgi:hypothetical protein